MLISLCIGIYNTIYLNHYNPLEKLYSTTFYYKLNLKIVSKINEFLIILLKEFF